MKTRWHWIQPALARRAVAGALVALAMASLAAIGYASSRSLLGYTYGYQYQYCTNPSQDQYCTTTTTTGSSTSTTSSTTTTPQPVLDCFDRRSAARDEPEVRVPGPGGGHFEQCELRVSDVTKTESNSGLKGFTFTVSLNHPPVHTVTVDYATGGGTATAGSDYAAKSGTLTFPKGATLRAVVVLVKGDRVVEPDETFFVNLSNASSNTIVADPQGRGTIVNDDH
jgi:Calx-beta domain